MTGTTVQVAIIGGGPRGLWAVEQLLSEAARHLIQVDIDMFEPGELGEGSAYGRDEPDHWRVNVPSHVIRTNLGDFDAWRRARGEEEPLAAFPPRRLVGEFLHESWRALLGELPGGTTVRHLRRRAGVIDPAESGWSVDGAPYDEVLVVTGHAADWPGALEHVGGVGGDVVAAYPASELDRVPAGAEVAVRGMALSFIDTVLALTEGRGGQFRPGGYRPSGMEPRVIRPWSRGGRFMVAKPAPDSPLGRLDVAGAVARGRRRVWLAGDLPEFEGALADTAAEMLEVAWSGDRPVGAAERAEIRSVLAGDDAGGDPVAELRASRDVAAGVAPADAAWAVGETWRQVYPAIVGRTSYGGRDDLPGFGELARRLERVGFGPPVVNIDKILTLIDAGFVEPTDERGELDTKVWVDAVLAPPGIVPGTLTADLVERGLARKRDGARGVAVERDGTVTGQQRLAIIGRDAEDVVLGPDTLNRALHDVIPRWAQRVVKQALRQPEPAARGMHATVPLTARQEPWLTRLLADPARVDALTDEFGSPVNVLRTEPMLRNIDELIRAGRDRGVDTRVFFARKANKALAFVDAVRDGGHSVDVAGENELRQVLDRGVVGENIILSAAVKPDRLLELAVRRAVTISVDSIAELRRIEAIAGREGKRARIAPRLAPDPATLPPTRFGERLDTWCTAVAELDPAGGVVVLVGVHLHLHGYAATDRQLALGEAFTLIDAAVAAGHDPAFIDLGGGVPMSYLDDAEQWDTFQHELAEQNRNGDPHRAFTWKADPLRSTYPFHQRPTRGDWLRELLAGSAAPGRPSIAAEFIRRGLRLHLEPGRSVLDGCGVILARVAFLKTRSDGVPLVGLEMNRTQCRTTSDDILLDPVLVRHTGHSDPDAADPGWGPGAEGFLVGAYCIEDEVIVRRKMTFPTGIAPGDIVAIPNTAGYFMHILESASHQIPLARNVELTGAAGECARLDDIDAPRPAVPVEDPHAQQTR